MAYVPSSVVKEILVQPDSEGKRGRWIAKVMEYDVDIKPTKLVKDQGLAKLLTEYNCQVLDLHLMAENSKQDVAAEHNKQQIYGRYYDSSLYKEIVYFLLYLQCPREFNRNQCR